MCGRKGRIASLAVTPTVVLDAVSKRFGTVEALRRVSLEVFDGEVVTLLGPSGSGKTTLLRIVAGLEPASAGMVEVHGGDPRAARASKRIAFVPQSPALLPWRTVAANARLLLEVNRSANAPDHPDADELLADVGLGEFRDALPHELSGGMQQRVGLVRAFALGAPILLLDEPFAALDEITRAEMRHLLARLCERIPTTVVFVTHSIAEAVFLSDRVAVLSPRPGEILEVVDIGLPRPRRAALEDDTRFFDLELRLRHALQQGFARRVGQP